MKNKTSRTRDPLLSEVERLIDLARKTQIETQEILAKYKAALRTRQEQFAKIKSAASNRQHQIGSIKSARGDQQEEFGKR